MNLRFPRFPLRRALTGTACLALAATALAQTAQPLTFDGGSDDRSNAVATDSAGNIFVGGSSSSSAQSFVVLKYNAAGSLQWQARPQGLGEYTLSAANDVAVDAAGNSYAVGIAGKSLPMLQTDWGWVVASFDPAGNQRWVRLYNGPGTIRDSAFRVAVHPSQGLYVTGITTDASGSSDWLTIRYALDGTEQWRRTEGSATAAEQPGFVKTDAAGNALVVGLFQGSFTSRPNVVHVVKYDPQGNVLWRADYHHTEVSDETPGGAVVDAAGNLYIGVDSLATVSAESTSTPTTLKYSPDGSLAFVLRGTGLGGGSIALDGANALIVSGVAMDDAGTNLRPATSKLTPAGALVWTQPVSGQHLAVDPVDHSITLTRDFHYAAMKLNANGQQLWVSAITPDARVSDATLDEATGAYLVTGTSGVSNLNILTTRYTTGGTPPPPPPPPPAGPTAPSGLDLNAKKGSLTLNWNDNANNETGFSIERSVNGAAFAQVAQVGANVRTFTNTGLNKNSTYAYRVRAFNANGNSAFSNTATGSPR